MKSIIQTEKQCYFCHTTSNLHLHHCFLGSRKKAADKHGFTVWLCLNHHTGDEGVHKDNSKLLELKQECQRTFEETHTREEFMKIIGRNYIE